MRRRVIGAAGALVVTAVVAGLLPVAPADAAAPGTPPLFAPTYMSKAKLYSTADAVTIATNYDLIVANPRQFNGADLAAMRAANPEVKVLVYLNGAFDMATTPQYPDNMYARDADGNIITSVKYKNYLMDVSNPAWATAVSNACTMLEAPGFDGCFVDMLGQSLLGKHYLTALPIDPVTGQAWTAPDWQAAMTAIGQRVQADHPNDFIMGNGLSQGQNYWAPVGPSSVLFDVLDNALAEVWMRQAQFAPTKYKTPAQWQQDVNILSDAATRGTHAAVTVKVWSAATPAQIESLHRYTLASFLLGSDGASWYSFTTSQSATEFQTDAGAPLDHIQVGTPTETYHAVGAAYARTYTGAQVFVNPTKNPVTVPLAASCTTLDGVGVSGTLTLLPESGEICRM